MVNKDGKPLVRVKVKGKMTILSPEEVSAMVLTGLVAYAKEFLGKEILTQ